MRKNNSLGLLALGTGLGLLAGWSAAQFAWVANQLKHNRVQQLLAAPQNTLYTGLTYSAAHENAAYTVRHTIENGIERIVYTPKQRRFETPILMQHGMWHGAWCWQHWQALFAEWGWESHAISLPGHGLSPVQRPIRMCTLEYYLSFLKDEVKRLPRKPILMGHSMGGALTQWYLKYVGDDLPAAVLVAPWVSHNALADGLVLFFRADPLGCLLCSTGWSATGYIRTPASAARLLISENAIYTPEELQARLGPESALITWEHSPPRWQPAENVQTPMLWVAAEKDAVVSVAGQRSSAAHYKADFLLVKDAAHNLMMEHNYIETAQSIHEWLSQVIT